MLTTETIAGIIRNLVQQVTPTKGVQAAGELRHWFALSLALKGEEAEPAGADWANMSEQQRATLRATMLRIAEEREAHARAQAEPSARTDDPREERAST